MRCIREHRPKLFPHLSLFFQYTLYYFTFQFRGALPLHFRDADNIVLDQSGIHVIYRYPDLYGIADLRFVKSSGVDQIAREDPGKRLLQDLVHCRLQIPVDTEIDVLSHCLFLQDPALPHDPSDIVHDDRPLPADPLQLRLKILLDTGFPDNRVHRISGIFRLQRFQLLRRDVSDIAQNVGKRLPSRIHALPVLRHLDLRKTALVFHHKGHCLLRDVSGYGDSLILLIRMQREHVPDPDDIQHLLF